MNRVLLFAIGVLFVAVGSAGAQTLRMPEVPELSVTVEPAAVRERGWYVQGQIVVTARIASKFPFEALDFSLPDFAGADVVQLQQPRTRKVKSYIGSGVVLEAVVALFPRRPGTFTIPAMRARGMVMSEDGREIRFDDTSEPIEVRVAGIDPGYDDPWWMVSPRVEIAETWSKPVEEAREGDVLRREITVTATGVTADRIRIPEHGRTRSVQVSEADEDTRTEISPEGVIGIVRKAWDLKIENAGVVYISPIGIHYWDPVARTARKAAAAGHRLEPLRADGEAIARRLMAEARATHDGSRTIAIAVAALAIVPLLGLLAAVLWAALPSRADRRLARACRARPSPAELYRATAEWRAASEHRPAEIDGILGAAGAPLFSRDREEVDPRRISNALLRHARRGRLSRLGRWVKGLTGAVFGAATRLDDPGYDATGSPPARRNSPE